MSNENKENKYLEKIAKSDHMLKGWVSPAWQENAIAKDHGKKGPTGIGANVAAHYGGALRASGRGFLEGAGAGVVGAALGGGVAALAKNNAVARAAKGGLDLTKAYNRIAANVNPKAAAGIGALVGYESGGIHGVQKSLRNQASEHHKKYASDEEISKEAALADSAKRVANAVKGYAGAVKADAGQLGDQVSNARLAIKNNGLFTKGTASTFKTIAKNKAVQLGAGVAGAGAVGGGVALAKKKD